MNFVENNIWNGMKPMLTSQLPNLVNIWRLQIYSGRLTLDGNG